MHFFFGFVFIYLFFYLFLYLQFLLLSYVLYFFLREKETERKSMWKVEVTEWPKSTNDTLLHVFFNND